MTRKLLLVGVMICLGGCTMAPKYTRPEAPVPASWPSGPAYKETSSTRGAPGAAELPWREFFNDDRLQQVIDTALKNNRDLRVAALNVERARALYRVQRAELYPKVETGTKASKQRVRISGTTGLVTVEEYSVNLGVLSWEVDFFGRIRSLSNKALEEYFATEQGRRSAQILLISEVANAYLTLAADRENLKLAQFTLESQQAAYHLIQRRFDVGIAPELDLRQVQTRVDAARVDVAKYTELVAQDENALNLLAGSPVPAELLPKELSVVKPLPDVSPGTSSEVLLRRPDILQAESLL
ncbi:MAG: efflux transporter outer membrane subunit, partial [Deltaproteobacteria bacterium]|nr:efflux transporter outer membrane subunit [Deltaproteobacteria bacterium]